MSSWAARATQGNLFFVFVFVFSSLLPLADFICRETLSPLLQLNSPPPLEVQSQYALRGDPPVSEVLGL